MKNKKGFTLIELLVVVVLLGIITTIVVIVINNVIKSSKGNAFYKSAQIIKLTANSLCESKKDFKADDIKEELNANGIKIEIVGKDILVQYEDDSKYSNLDLKSVDGEFTKLTDGYKFTINDRCGAKTSTTESKNYNEVDEVIKDTDTTNDDIDLLDVFYSKTKIVNSITEDICKDKEDEILDTDLIEEIEKKAKSNDKLKKLFESDIAIYGLQGYSGGMSKIDNSYNTFKMGLKKSYDNLNNEYDGNSSSNYNILVYVKENGIFNDLYGKNLDDVFKKRYNDNNYTWKIIKLFKVNLLGKNYSNIEKMSLIIKKEGEDNFSEESEYEKYYGLSFKTSCRVKINYLNQGWSK